MIYHYYVRRKYYAITLNNKIAFTLCEVPKPPPVKREPDTVIKLFLGSKTEEEEITDLREMLEFTKTFGKLEGTLVLRLREDIEGNVFNQPYQYMIIRFAHHHNYYLAMIWCFAIKQRMKYASF